MKHEVRRLLSPGSLPIEKLRLRANQANRVWIYQFLESCANLRELYFDYAYSLSPSKGHHLMATNVLVLIEACADSLEVLCMHFDGKWPGAYWNERRQCLNQQLQGFIELKTLSVTAMILFGLNGHQLIPQTEPPDYDSDTPRPRP